MEAICKKPSEHKELSRTEYGIKEQYNPLFDLSVDLYWWEMLLVKC